MREMERSNASSSPYPRRFFLLALLSSLFSLFLFIFFLIISRFFALGWHRRHVADFLWTARFSEYLTPSSGRGDPSHGESGDRIYLEFSIKQDFMHMRDMLFYITLSRWVVTKGRRVNKTGHHVRFKLFLTTIYILVLETYLLLLTISALVDAWVAKMQGNVLDLMKNYRTHISRYTRIKNLVNMEYYFSFFALDDIIK